MPSEPPTNGYIPVVLALIVCDCAHRDVATGKHTLIGTFNGIMVNHFPTTLNMIAVYIAVTEVLGQQNFKLNIVDANEKRAPLFNVDFPLKCN